MAATGGGEAGVERDEAAVGDEEEGGRLELNMGVDKVAGRRGCMAAAGGETGM